LTDMTLVPIPAIIIPRWPLSAITMTIAILCRDVISSSVRDLIPP
jgi:hypothetical protein